MDNELFCYHLSVNVFGAVTQSKTSFFYAHYLCQTIAYSHIPYYHIILQTDSWHALIVDRKWNGVNEMLLVMCYYYTCHVWCVLGYWV